jgi:hypothetical protein
MMTTSCRMLSVLVTLGFFCDFQGEKLHHLMLGIAQYNRAPDDRHGIIFLLGAFSANGLGFEVRAKKCSGEYLAQLECM